MTDVLVRLVDLVYQFLNRDIVLRSICQTLVERLLQSGILVLSVLEQLLHAALLLLQGTDASVLRSQVFLGGLKALSERLVLRLAVSQVFLTGATGHYQTHGQCHQNHILFHNCRRFYL